MMSNSHTLSPTRSAAPITATLYIKVEGLKSLCKIYLFKANAALVPRACDLRVLYQYNQ